MTINCNGSLVDLNFPKVMGILNLTPNSFYDGGQNLDQDTILQKVDTMLKDGATFIDVGAYSSKPSAEFVTETEELARIVPVVNLLLKHYPDIILSIDTFRAEVANICINEGASIINDISSGNLDVKMFEVVAKHQVPYIMMHMQGNPQTMQNHTTYENILKDILYYFSQKINAARALGINDLILDPGFGFSKTKDQNFEILEQLELLNLLELPVLAGVSRKSMIYNTLNCTPQEALNGTTVLNTIALSKGAKILRVHDVKEAFEAVNLYTKTFKSNR